MRRTITNEFKTWFEEENRRILYVQGAYGVGKTHLVNTFMNANFGGITYIDLSANQGFLNAVSGKKTQDKNEELSIFLSEEDIENVTIEQRINDLDFMFELHFENESPVSNVIVFDEIGLVSDALEFFHAYAEKYSDLILVLISSSMDMSEYAYNNQGAFFNIRMRPLTFSEYLLANSEEKLIDQIYAAKEKKLKKADEDKVLQYMKEYILVGGMPACVDSYIESHDLAKVRKIQEGIIENYEKLIRNSFSNAIGSRCRRIFKSIPKQLEKDNKKFMYTLVDSNARSREYKDSVGLLIKLGIARMLPRIKAVTTPLEDSADYNSFELFFVDHGLLRAISKLPMDDSKTLEEICAEANGAIIEQYVFEELSNIVNYPYYWTSGATARVAFVYEAADTVENEDGSVDELRYPVPIDIRTTPNNKAQNIKTFFAKSPSTEIAIKLSLEPCKLDGNIINLPIYGIFAL